MVSRCTTPKIQCGTIKVIEAFYSFQDTSQRDSISRESVSLQESSTISPDNTTFFKPPSCTPTKKVSGLLLQAQQYKQGVTILQIPQWNLTFVFQFMLRFKVFVSTVGYTIVRLVLTLKRLKHHWFYWCTSPRPRRHPPICQTQTDKMHIYLTLLLFTDNFERRRHLIVGPTFYLQRECRAQTKHVC